MATRSCSSNYDSVGSNQEGIRRNLHNPGDDRFPLQGLKMVDHLVAIPDTILCKNAGTQAPKGAAIGTSEEKKLRRNNKCPKMITLPHLRHFTQPLSLYST